ncbi:unnamed protein product [Nezara viridula]|uniref:Uncharacterized protein n=1 Tax=Nezara viridula TaxID=85310 RepID=A0A9P0EF23_NEZVI|nr:unnamed protein product [Nezara viridula]
MEVTNLDMGSYNRERTLFAFLVSEWLELKVLEVTPELTQLGSTLKEAEELRRSHHEVISKIQIQQSESKEPNQINCGADISDNQRSCFQAEAATLLRQEMTNHNVNSGERTGTASLQESSHPVQGGSTHCSQPIQLGIPKASDKLCTK